MVDMVEIHLRSRKEDQLGSTITTARPSLFARLTPSVVEQLSKGTPYDVRPTHGSAQLVEFLPLSITFGDNTTVYASYNGGEAGDGGDEEILDLPACMIPKGVMENSRVSVAVVASIQDAATVNVEPLTCDDWELLETAAEFLEDGALLQQVSVLYSNQILPLWVGRKDVAWIRVLPDSFGQRTSVWPSGDNEPDDCCRLVRDTRVVVAPKTRRKNGPLSSPLLRVFPTRQDYSVATNKLAEWLGKMQVSLTPGTVVLNPATRHQIQGLGQEESAALVAVWDTANGSFSDDSSRSCILQVAFSDLVPPEHLGELLSACESEYQLLSRTDRKSVV